MSDQIFEQIRDLIFRGHLKPGQRLWSERRMSQTFAVSRPTVREAMHKLIDRGLIEHRRGVGTFVRLVEHNTDSNPLLQILGGREPNLEELIEVRMPLECSGAKLAAERAGREDLSRLEVNIHQMTRQVEIGRIAVDEDASFHMNIAFATNNGVHIHLMRSFYDLLQYFMNRIYHEWYAIAGNDRLALNHHLMILESIRRRDPPGAEAAMCEHMNALLELARRSQR